MSETASLPAPGQIARIRQRTYLVEQVVKPKRVADSTLVRLSCVDDDNHRIREVIAQVGFTRFEAISPDIDGELEMGVRRASLTSDDPQWLPAIENRGEGIFLQLNKEAVEKWLAREDVVKRGEVLERGHRAWAEERNFTKAGQERNIEVGLKIQSPWLAGRLIRHFQLLHEHGLAVRAF